MEKISIMNAQNKVCFDVVGCISDLDLLRDHLLGIMDVEVSFPMKHSSNGRAEARMTVTCSCEDLKNVIKSIKNFSSGD